MLKIVSNLVLVVVLITVTGAQAAEVAEWDNSGRRKTERPANAY
jgi:hypothetical protein